MSAATRTHEAFNAFWIEQGKPVPMSVQTPSDRTRLQLLAYQAARQNEDAFDGGQGAIALTEELIRRARPDGIYGQVMIPVGVAEELVRKALAA